MLTVIKTSAEFKRISDKGRKHHASAFVMLGVQTGEGASFRLGLTSSRRVGNAVRRNRAKRRLREMVRISSPPPPPGWDIVLIARQSATDHDFARMCEDFQKGLKALGAVT